MRPLVPLLLAIATLAGCGGGGGERVAGTTPGTTTEPSTGAATGSATATAPQATERRPQAAASGSSPFVVLTALLGKPLPNEPGCRFNRTFTPDRPSSTAYDGAGTLTVACRKERSHQPVGQVVNRSGSTPSAMTCRDTKRPELYCIYVPSGTVGMYFTGTDRAVTRRRLRHLIAAVERLPKGITPLSGASSR